MPTVLLLGNTAPVDSVRGADDELTRTSRPDLGNRITTVSLPEDAPMPPSEVLRSVRDLWPWHSDADGPEWVECDDDEALAGVVAAEFTTPDHACSVGRPKGWEEG